MVQKGDIIVTTIEDISGDGAGIGKVDGMAVFIDGCMPGDTVRAEVTKAKKNYAFARTLEITEFSADRISPLCPHYASCGGCTYQEYDYDAQLVLKERQVRDKLERIGGLKEPVIREIIGQKVTDEDGTEYIPFRYRNKGDYPVWNNLVGFYEKKSHKIVDVKECLLQSEAADAVTRVIRSMNKGEIKNVVVKTAFGTGEVMAVLSCRENPSNLEAIITSMDEAAAEADYSLESVYTRINDKYRCVAGARTILDQVEIDGRELSFEISAPSFYQVNTEQMKKLYEKAIEYAALTGEETVLDLYCGIGTIGISMAARAKQIVGIEVVKEAVLDANRNSVINGIVNTRYICGKAEEVIEKAASEDYSPRENSAEAMLQSALNDDKLVAVLDPPRAGCDEVLLRTIAEAGAGRIVYISCDPGTLARDIKLLGELGYEFVEATPVDMFGWTNHVETVSLLVKR